MFERSEMRHAAVAVATTLPVDLPGLMGQLAALDGAGVGDRALITGIDALERMKAACAAAQARLTARFVESQAQEAARLRAVAQDCSDARDFDGWVAARDLARSLELPPEPRPGSPAGSAGAGFGTRDGSGSASRRGRAVMVARTGVAAQVGLARRESPARGARLARAAVALVDHHPHTLAALTAGHLTERRAELVIRGTSHLTADLRAVVDAEVIGANLPGDPDSPTVGVAGWGDREVERRIKACADRLDPDAAVERAGAAATGRRVTSRPMPDCMAVVSALLPVEMAVAVHAALVQAAATAKAAGDPRSRGQVMADTLVDRVTGKVGAAAADLAVQVVITDRALFQGDDTPAHVPGYGSVPAGWLRDLLTRDLGRAHDPGTGDHSPPGGHARVWLRRLYTHPGTGTLVAMDSTSRLFPAGLRRFLIARDGVCRTPWCDAPVRHADHVTPHAAGGPTSDTNGQGLCIACNLTKDLPGWHSRVVDAGPTAGSAKPHQVEISTPTGHTYTSIAPPVLPGLIEPSTAGDVATPSACDLHQPRSPLPPAAAASLFEAGLLDLLAA